MTGVAVAATGFTRNAYGFHCLTGAPGPSPISAYLHATCGEIEVMKNIDATRTFWAGGMDPLAFLMTQPKKPVAAIARAAGNIIDTRRDRLFALAERLEA